MPKVKSNGIELYYEERGTGEPLLLIMGLGADGLTWEEHLRAYEKHFRCIIFDNRGVGRSDKPEGPYTTRMMADDSVGLLNALGIESAHISGISMGGAIAQELAINYPEKVKSTTIISSWPKCDAYTVRIFETFRSMNGTVDPVSFNRMVQLIIFTPWYHEFRMDDLLKREEAGMANPYPTPVHGYRAQCDACISHDTIDRLKLIKSPTLVVAGDKDIFTPLKYSEEIAGRIPGAELFVLRDAGHTCHFERIKEFNRKTLEFLLENRT